MITENRIYLGDGVYASFDGLQICLTINHGFGVEQHIYLPIGVFLELVRYGKDMFRITK